MINVNGEICTNSNINIENNRGFLFGDAVFETLKIVNSKILFSEDHYFRLMASMRICRMRIPMDFTLEYFENQILELVNTLNIQKSARVRITFYRNNGGFYSPNTNESTFIISANSLEKSIYEIEFPTYEVELFKDFSITKHLLSTIKTSNKMVNILAAIFAKENDFQNCLLINEDKNIVEAIQSNVFMVLGNQVITPPLSEGCLNGIMRKNIISILKKMEDYEIIEKPISPFDLQKADELFLTNVIFGVQPITKYRKKEYQFNLSKNLVSKINELI